MSTNLVKLGFITDEQALEIEKTLLRDACTTCHGVSTDCEHCSGSGFEMGPKGVDVFIGKIVECLSEEHKTLAAKWGISALIGMNN